MTKGLPSSSSVPVGIGVMVTIDVVVFVMVSGGLPYVALQALGYSVKVITCAVVWLISSKKRVSGARYCNIMKVGDGNRKGATMVSAM